MVYDSSAYNPNDIIAQSRWWSRDQTAIARLGEVKT